MRRSEKVAIWIGVVIFLIGAFASLFVFPHFMPWQSAAPHEISLSFSGETKEMVFAEVDINEFQKLSLSESYYQISVKATDVTVHAMGIEGNTVYIADQNYDWLEGYKYVGYDFSQDILTIFKVPDLFAYLFFTGILIVVVAIASAILSLLIAVIGFALEEARQ